MDRKQDPMQEMVELYLPRASGKEEPFVFIGLNGKGYQIQKGERVKVPKPVAQVLELSEQAKAKQQAYVEACARQQADR